MFHISSGSTLVSHCPQLITNERQYRNNGQTAETRTTATEPESASASKLKGWRVGSVNDLPDLSD